MLYASTSNPTFTQAHAKKISYRVSTDLKRMQRFYGRPTDYQIEVFDLEIVEFMKAMYLETVTYGYMRNNRWIEPTLRYTAFELANKDIGDDPGRIQPNANVKDATFYTYLVYSHNWNMLSLAETDSFEKNLPVQRIVEPEPGIDGYLNQDLAYSAGGRGLLRETVRSWA